ncbi:hypothetical protein [Brasilonema sp. UFV-L1]|uniref:hypothetical protein n=1 Tax=Brasilonema sp. UFV-L1 TaxID=2234130 RepID=UPI00145F4CE4|nr:hypothetical protein [Brasilonema sp. UFV-L1]NMG07121.1 hypothetical protein [Brasilonema sp. UFV-L1]
MSIPIQVSPPTNDLSLSKDQTLAELVKVSIPKSGVVPKVDVYFLADTTGSMAPAIAAVKSGIMDVLTQIQALGSDVWFGVGDYKDFPAPVAEQHPYAFAHQCSLSANIAAVKAAVDTWTTTPGKDIPEAQFYGLDQVAEPPGGKIGWRADAKRIIVWFGDAAGHDAVCQKISGLSYDITEASVTAKLVAEKIKVLALSLNINPNSPEGLDDEPKLAPQYNGYQEFCGDSGGTKGQGTRIAKATGCKLVQGVSVDTIIETITTELAAQITAFGNISLVASGATAQFVQAIAPPAGHGPLSRDQDHELTFNVDWIGTVEGTSQVQVFSGSLDVIADGEVVGGKTVQITVPISFPPLPPLYPEEDIMIPRPDDVSGTWMLIHQMTASYLLPANGSPNLNDLIWTWNQDPPNTTAWRQGHLWVLEKQTDGTYRIRTLEVNQLYIQAPIQPAANGSITLQQHSQSELQSWVLVPVSGDPNTYAIQPKSFPNSALGLFASQERRDSNANGMMVVASNTWGKPTFHQYWRLSQPPANAK